MYDAILCPTDGSAGSDAAVEQACDLAELTGARIHALFVVDEGSRALTSGTLSSTGRKSGASARSTRLPRRPRTAVSRSSATSDAVARTRRSDAATDYGVDLIVMGTHGRTGLGRFVTAGSVAERVVRHSKLPVLTAHIGD